MTYITITGCARCRVNPASEDSSYCKKCLIALGYVDDDQGCELRLAARAVLDRWDSVLWKDMKPTARYMKRLRAALDAEPAPLPDEPTEAMLRAWYEAKCPPNDTPAGGLTRWATWDDAKGVMADEMRRCYRAMRDAMPTNREAALDLGSPVLEVIDARLAIYLEKRDRANPCGPDTLNIFDYLSHTIEALEMLRKEIVAAEGVKP